MARRSLTGKVAVVAGATRGAGRGIARGLGEAGAIVYCTGRSAKGRRSPYNRPETIEETADLVTAAGGTGIPVRVDHTVEREIQNLFARVEADHGRLDVLVNSVAGEDPTLAWMKPLTQIEMAAAETLVRQAVLSHLVTASHAARLMTAQRSGLIVEVTEGDTLMGGGAALLSCFVKTSLKLLAFIIAEELRPRRVAAVAVTPGYLRSETMLEHFGVTEANWRDGGKKDAYFLQSETPLFLGRGVAALAADPKVLRRSGALLSSWALAREYGVVDAGGDRPDWGAQFDEKTAPKWMKEGFGRQFEYLSAHAQLSARYARRAPPLAKR